MASRDENRLPHYQTENGKTAVKQIAHTGCTSTILHTSIFIFQIRLIHTRIKTNPISI
ncbi:hypothetical protein C7S14_1882 [Burkholderia cepacia]|nr:hypothetical protein C7S14_1882 [Burkholderia cepacia]